MTSSRPLSLALIFGVLLSLLGPSARPIAQAQDGSETPPPPTVTSAPTPAQELVSDITIDFDTVVRVPEYLRPWVSQALLERSSVLPNGTLFYSTAFRLSEGIDWARIVWVPSYVIESGWENVVMDDVVEVLAYRQSVNNWIVHFYKDENFSSFYQNAPSDFIDFSAAYSLAEVHRFPWTEGQSWWKNGGWHGDNWGGCHLTLSTFSQKAQVHLTSLSWLQRLVCWTHCVALIRMGKCGSRLRIQTVQLAMDILLAAPFGKTSSANPWWEVNTSAIYTQVPPIVVEAQHHYRISILCFPTETSQCTTLRQIGM
jgi:hypothetical protein